MTINFHSLQRDIEQLEQAAKEFDDLKTRINAIKFSTEAGRKVQQDLLTNINDCLHDVSLAWLIEQSLNASAEMEVW